MMQPAKTEVSPPPSVRSPTTLHSIIAAIAARRIVFPDPQCVLKVQVTADEAGRLNGSLKTSTEREHNSQGWLDPPPLMGVGDGRCTYSIEDDGMCWRGGCKLASAAGVELSPRTGDQPGSQHGAWYGCQRGSGVDRLAAENGHRPGPGGVGLADRVGSAAPISRQHGGYWHLESLNWVKTIRCGNVRAPYGPKSAGPH